MMSPRPGRLVGPVRLLTVLAPLAVLAALVAGCGSGANAAACNATPAPSPSAGSSAAAQPAVTRVELRFAGGSVVGGAGRQVVPLCGTVELVVSSDVADQVHVHGYDKLADVPAGGSTTISFLADVPGVFEVELHEQDTLLTRLEVR